MSLVPYEWVMSKVNQSCDVWMSRFTYEWGMTHIFSVMRFGAESCHERLGHASVSMSYFLFCHVWISHVTYEYVTSHINEASHIWMNHVTHERVMPHMNMSCQKWMNCMYDWVVSRTIWLWDISVMISCYTCEWVRSHMNESCYIRMSHVTYECVMLHMNESYHIWMSHVTYEWVMSHMNESCHI